MQVQTQTPKVMVQLQNMATDPRIVGLETYEAVAVSSIEVSLSSRLKNKGEAVVGWLNNQPCSASTASSISVVGSGGIFV